MTTPELSHENLLGPYRLLRVLGEGGMGTVYLAHDPSLDRQVAIKVLRFGGEGAAAGARGAAGGDGAGDVRQPGARAVAAMAKRFMREAQSAARLNHQNVVTIYSVGEHAARPYIVMEYVEGGSLAEHVRKSGPMHWRAAAEAMRDALRGLAAAHRAGIVHRDVKPANLMRARGNNGEEIIKLADFGLARVTAGIAGSRSHSTALDGELTFPGAFVGSPSYSSPEQVAGAHQLDGRADLYSLAATCYALLTGQPPFVEDDPADIMERHMSEPFPDVRLLAPSATVQMQSVLERASRKQPGERFGGAQEMLEAVERLLASPADVAAGAAQGSAAPRAAAAVGRDVPRRAEETVVALETRLAAARKASDSSTQLATLRTLYGLYAQLDRRDEATRAYREALAIHVKMHAPFGANN